MDFIFRNIESSLNSAKQRYLNTGKTPPEIFQFFSDVDYTASKKYLEWLCKTLDNSSRDKDIKNKIFRFCNHFHNSINPDSGHNHVFFNLDWLLPGDSHYGKVDQRMEEAKLEFSTFLRDYERGVQAGIIQQKDINDFGNDIGVFIRAVEEARPLLSSPHVSKILPRLTEGFDYLLLKNGDPKWTLVLVKTYRASVMLGGPINWCVIKRESDFDTYLEQFDFMIFAFRSGRFLSYCIHIRIFGGGNEVKMLITRRPNEVEWQGTEGSEKVLLRMFGFEIGKSGLVEMTCSPESFVVFDNVSLRDRYESIFAENFSFSEVALAQRPALYVKKPHEDMVVTVNNKSYRGRIDFKSSEVMAKDFHTDYLVFQRNDNGTAFTFRIKSSFLEDIGFDMSNPLGGEQEIPVYFEDSGSELLLRGCLFSACAISLGHIKKVTFSDVSFISCRLYPFLTFDREIISWSIYDTVSDIYSYRLINSSFYGQCTLEGNFVLDNKVEIKKGPIYPSNSCIIYPYNLHQISGMDYTLMRDSGCSVHLPVYSPVSMKFPIFHLFARLKTHPTFDYIPFMEEVEEELSKLNMDDFSAELEEKSAGLSKYELWLSYCKTMWDRVYANFFKKRLIMAIPWVARDI